MLDPDLLKKVMEAYPLFYMGEEWWNKDRVYFKNKEIYPYELKVIEWDNQLFFHCTSIHLYLNINDMGGEAYCGSKMYHKSIFYLLLELNICLYHDTIDMVALERKWKLDKIIKP